MPDMKASVSEDADFDASVRAEQARLRDRMVNEHRLSRLDRMGLTGLRLADRSNPEAGMVITFTEDEAEPVLAAIRSVLEARVGQE